MYCSIAFAVERSRRFMESRVAHRDSSHGNSSSTKKKLCTQRVLKRGNLLCDFGIETLEDVSFVGHGGRVRRVR